MTAQATKRITAEELIEMGDIGRCELIYGDLIMMSPAGFGHGEIALRIGRLLGNFVEEHDLGVVLAAETGYLVETDPDLVRAPDASFVRKDRLPKAAWNKFFPGVPDLAVEVLSPDDSRRQVAEKVNMWLAHGTVCVWVVDPGVKTIVVNHTGREPLPLTRADELSNEPLLPGFVLKVSKVFDRH